MRNDKHLGRCTTHAHIQGAALHMRTDKYLGGCTTHAQRQTFGKLHYTCAPTNI
jgi:hypothetical protein